MNTSLLCKAMPRLFFTCFLAVGVVDSSAAFTIDGSVADWGILLNTPAAAVQGYLDTHLPSGGRRITYVTEDNADESRSPLAHGAWRVGPEFSVGNMCDAEALYVDNDDTNLYIALIQGLPINGSAVSGGWSPSYIWPGDIALNVGGGTAYGFGIASIDATYASLVQNVSWMTGQFSGTPYRINDGDVVAPISFAYATSGINGHYAVEAAIPLASLGLSMGDPYQVHWTMSCGNDMLTLAGTVTPVPEVSTMMMMMTGFVGILTAYIRKRYDLMKRVMDICISVVTLVVFFPVLLLSALLIKLDSPGPVFFGQVRVGLNRRKNRIDAATGEQRKDANLGCLFTMYKLRTMRIDAEAKTGPVWAAKNDPRITRIGKILRKTHIDEIPQFYNVLRGDMSIVGPRPERPVFVNQLDKTISYYHKRFKVKPGITGLAQVRYQYADSIADTRKKARYDALYIRKKCMLADMSIFINTFSRVLFDKGAH